MPENLTQVLKFTSFKAPSVANSFLRAAFQRAYFGSASFGLRG